jgi:hypothetical protein
VQERQKTLVDARLELRAQNYQAEFAKLKTAADVDKKEKELAAKIKQQEVFYEADIKTL